MPLEEPTRKPWDNPLEDTIAKHWENNFQKQAAALKKAGQFESAVKDAADRGARVMEQAKAKGLNWSQAKELEVEEWGAPPNL